MVNEYESPIYGELGKPGEPTDAQLDKFEEATRIIEHVKQYIRQAGVMVYVAPHEPLDAKHHTPEEYQRIVNRTVRSAVLANQKR